MRMARRLLGFWDRKRSVPGIVGELVVSEIWDIFWYRVGAVFRRRRVLILKGSRITWDELRFRVCRNAYFWINTNIFSPFRKGPPRVRGSWSQIKWGTAVPCHRLPAATTSWNRRVLGDFVCNLATLHSPKASSTPTLASPPTSPSRVTAHIFSAGGLVGAL